MSLNVWQISASLDYMSKMLEDTRRELAELKLLSAEKSVAGGDDTIKAVVEKQPNKFYEDVLDSRMQENDAEADTIREYLQALLTTLWIKGECFNSKHPFGNSGWEHDLYLALVKWEYIDGDIYEEYGILNRFDHESVNALIFDLIDYVFSKKG